MQDVNISLNHRIEIWQEAENDTNEYGESSHDDELVGYLWALVVPNRGNEYRENYKLTQSQSYKITIRKTNGLNPSMWVVFNGKRLDIEAIQDLQSRNMYMELVCNERVEQ